MVCSGLGFTSLRPTRVRAFIGPRSTRACKHAQLGPTGLRQKCYLPVPATCSDPLARCASLLAPLAAPQPAADSHSQARKARCPSGTRLGRAQCGTKGVGAPAMNDRRVFGRRGRSNEAGGTFGPAGEVVPALTLQRGELGPSGSPLLGPVRPALDAPEAAWARRTARGRHRQQQNTQSHPRPIGSDLCGVI